MHSLIVTTSHIKLVELEKFNLTLSKFLYVCMYVIKSKRKCHILCNNDKCIEYIKEKLNFSVIKTQCFVIQALNLGNGRRRRSLD